MKKILLFTLLVLCARFASAQTCNYTNYTISPATYTAEDEVTINFDFTGTDLAGETDVYIWTWSNAGDGITNTDWNNAPATAKLTPVAGSPNKFTFKLVGTTMYNKSPGQLKQFQFLGKTKNGSKKSCDSKANVFDPLVFVPSMQRIFPARVGQNDVVSLYFHQDLATTINEQRMQPVSVTVEVFDNNDVSAGAPVTLPVKSAGEKLWKAYFIPTRSYTLGAGKKFVRFTYKFNGTVQDANNQPVTVGTPVVEVPLNEMK